MVVGLLWTSVVCHAQLDIQKAKGIVSAYLIEEKVNPAYRLYVYGDGMLDYVKIPVLGDTIIVQEAFVYFIDEYPSANWSHSARFLFVSEDGVLEEKKTVWPPDNIDNWNCMSGELKVSSGMLYDFSAMPQRKSLDRDMSHCHAVIISGGVEPSKNYVRYWNDCSAMYKTLVNAYGYRPDHIYVIMSDGTDPAEDMRFISGGYGSSPLDLDGNGTSDIQYAATKSNISYVFSELGGKLTEEDNLFVFVTDHGSISGSAVSIVLWNGVLLSPAEFSAELNKVDAGAVNIMMAQCFSGGFIPALEGQGRVISTACSASEQSFSAPNHVYDEFPYHWISAVCGFTPDGNPVDADVNDDGFVSMMEAFQYARTHDVYVSGQGEYQETPQYSSQPSNFGDRLTLRGIEVCTTTRLSNQTISSIREVEDCSIEVNNVSVKTGGRLILHYDESVLLNAGFSMEVGAELIIED